MADINQLLRGLPRVDELMAQPGVARLLESHPYTAVLEAVRCVLDTLRGDVRAERLACLPDASELCRLAARELAGRQAPSLRRVINATGVVLHTNFGRAPLAAEAVEAVTQAARGYSNLEYNLADGARGSRHDHVAELLCQLTGAQDALAVNNNAAAVLLVLSALAAGGEVVISRGELVEIGGAFRVPDVMTQSGCVLREVGTTNKTHLRDYQAEVGERTTALLKVHTSNFRLVGFTQSVELAELAGLAKSHGLPLIHDLGSGCLADPGRIGAPDEPTVRHSIEAGADVTTFSGDKLLGGPQAGIIVGRADLIARIKKHPLARAVRIDKLTLAALEATLRLYLYPETAEQVPIVAMLSMDSASLKAKAEALAGQIEAQCAGLATWTVAPGLGQVGGGSAPGVDLESWGVAVTPARVSLQQLEQRLRRAPVPIVGRVTHERLVLDARTLDEADFSYIAQQLRAALSEV